MNKIAPLTIQSPRIWDSNYTLSPNGYRKGFITNEFDVNPQKLQLNIKSFTCGIELYQKLKDLWRSTDLICYSFPMVMITPNCFEMVNGWSLRGIQYIVDCGWTDGNTRYLLFRGIGIPVLPEDNPMVGRDPILRYKKSRNGCQYVFRNSWSRPQVIRYEDDDTGLWLYLNGEEYDVCEALGYRKIPMPVIYVPWPFYKNHLVDAPYVENSIQLDDRLFEI